MLARADTRVRLSGRDFRGVRILFGDFRFVGATCRRLRRHDHRTPRPRTPRASWWSSHRTTATSFSTSSRAEFRSSESTPPVTLPRWRSSRGVPTLVDFFTEGLAERLAADGTRADLIVGNNVLAQVPDINDFVAGVTRLLAPGGVATFEFPHLARLLDGLQYDTIYHEHFSYFSLFTIREIFRAHGLSAVDVEELSSHGGSLRVYFEHHASASGETAAVAELLAREDQ